MLPTLLLTRSGLADADALAANAAADAAESAPVLMLTPLWAAIAANAAADAASFADADALAANAAADAAESAAGADAMPLEAAIAANAAEAQASADADALLQTLPLTPLNLLPVLMPTPLWMLRCQRCC